MYHMYIVVRCLCYSVLIRTQEESVRTGGEWKAEIILLKSDMEVGWLLPCITSLF